MSYVTINLCYVIWKYQGIFAYLYVVCTKRYKSKDFKMSAVLLATACGK